MLPNAAKLHRTILNLAELDRILPTLADPWRSLTELAKHPSTFLNATELVRTIPNGTDRY